MNASILKCKRCEKEYEKPIFGEFCSYLCDFYSKWPEEEPESKRYQYAREMIDFMKRLHNENEERIFKFTLELIEKVK